MNTILSLRVKFLDKAFPFKQPPFRAIKKHIRPVWKPNRKSARKTMNSKLTDNHDLTGAIS